MKTCQLLLVKLGEVSIVILEFWDCYVWIEGYRELHSCRAFQNVSGRIQATTLCIRGLREIRAHVLRGSQEYGTQQVRYLLLHLHFYSQEAGRSEHELVPFFSDIGEI